MKSGDNEQLGRGLMRHLHLSAAQAAVVLDDTSCPERLVLYVYDPETSRLPLSITNWQGHPVEVRRVTVGPH